jgi:hypothetical protein
VANGLERGTARLADALSDRICQSEDLVGLFVQQEVVVTEVRSAHVPVEVFRLQVKREDVCQDRVHGCRDVPGCDGLQIGGSGQRRLLSALEVLDVRGGLLHHDVLSYRLSLEYRMFFMMALQGGEAVLRFEPSHPSGARAQKE